MSVDIYSPEGTKVRFKETNPITWGVSAENAKYLVLDEIYTVEQMERHSYHTKMFLKEVPCIPFNTVWFDEVK